MDLNTQLNLSESFSKISDIFVTSVEAQATTTASAGTPQQPNPLVSMVPFFLIFIIFYFFLIRPQKKKMQEEQKLLEALKKGDEIFTKSGMLGTIWALNDKVVTLEVADGVKVKILRGHIGGLSQKVLETTAAITNSNPADSSNGKKGK